MINIKTDEIYGKNDVVNANDLRKRILNIDTRFRKTVLEPPTDCMYECAHVYKNVIRMRISSVEIPKGVYNFSRVKRNTMFRVDISDYVGKQHNIVVTIGDGEYTEDSLIGRIQGELNVIRDVYGIFLRIVRDEMSRRVTIICDGSGPPPCPPGPTHCAVSFGIMFGMVGLEEREFDFGLGYNLGFKNKYYTVRSPYSVTSESVINTNVDNYWLLGIDDLNTVEHKTNSSYVKCLGKILLKRDSKGNIINDDGYKVLSNEIVFQRPIDVKQMRVRLMDGYGEMVDLHNLNYSVSLEITEVMNVQMYEVYRKYLWEKEEPRATMYTNGSSSGIEPPSMNFN
jgi:hypothetical protein